MKEIIKLAPPLVITQLAQVAIGTIDVIMMGALGTRDIAAGGLAVVVFSLFLTFGNGVISSISNITAYEHGLKTKDLILGKIVKAGFVVAILLSVIFNLIAFYLPKILIMLGQDVNIVPITVDYLRITLPGIVLCMWFSVLRNFTVGLRRPGKLMVIALISIGLKVILNLICIYGYFGFPALGLTGIAWSDNLVFLCGFLIFAISIINTRSYDAFQIFPKMFNCTFNDITRIIRTGLPNAITYIAESGFFIVIALFMGHISEVALAAHIIVNQCVYTTFMVSVGISHAASMCIGHALGAKNYFAIRHYAYSALLIGAIFTTITGVSFWLFANQIMHIFIKNDSYLNAQVYVLGVNILVIAAVFQLFDSWQNIAIGALRGINAMQQSMFIALFGYWVVGLLLAYFLGFHINLGAIGVWWGLAGGLAITSMLLILCFEHVYRSRVGAILIEK